MALAQLPQYRLQGKHRKGHHHQRRQRQLPRHREHDRDGGDHLSGAPDGTRDQLGHDRFRIDGVGEHPRDHLTDLVGGKPAHRQAQQVGVQRIAQIAHHELLQLRPDLPAEPHEHVLEGDGQQHEDDHVAQ